MVLVDSSVWIDYFNGRETRQTELLHDLLGRDPLLIGDIILTEVLQGFRRDGDFRKAREALESLHFKPMLGRKMALASARNYRLLHKRGITVRKTLDVMIATFCIENNHHLLHADRDFDAMVGALGLRIL